MSNQLELEQALSWTRRIDALAKIGLEYTENPYDLERYHELQEIAAEMLGCFVDADLSAIRKVLALESGYVTPKVDTRGAIIRDNKILLVRERSDSLWTLPGGWADVNDTPRIAVEREILEEVGVVAECHKLYALHDGRVQNQHCENFFHGYKLFFLCNYVSGDPLKETTETIDADYFSVTDLPPLSIQRTSPYQIQLAFEHYNNPSKIAEID